MNKIIRFLLTIAVSSALFACSSTSEVPEGDRLYTGLEPIKYTDYESNEHFTATQEEIEAALDCPPNGAIFGSSYYRSPWQPAVVFFLGNINQSLVDLVNIC